MTELDDGHGIVVYRASRLEALLVPLESLLARFPPQDLLAPQLVLAAHPGIMRWLRQALARARGVGGIVANLDVKLPGAWLDARARELLGVSALSQAAYRREALRWRLFELLPRSRDPELLRYLADGDASRRDQLADHLAALYTRYMVYRPDWLARWQVGETSVPRPSFLAPLWRRLSRDIGPPHRGEVLRELAHALERAPSAASAEPLHVFGLNHLAPIELDVLRAEARHRLVVIYLPDPCVEFWAGIGDERARLQRLRDAVDESARERELLEINHPLLAAWGRLGQHFGLSLNAGEGRVRSDTRHWLDVDDNSEQRDLLPALQQSIRRLRVELVDPAMRDRAAVRRDHSLRVHGCHTRLRELEVLRDCMLDALRRDPSLHPSQMIVMSPNIGAYAALVPAVFGEPADYASALPYHLADLTVRQSHPVFAAFAALLELPTTRVGVDQVLDLLAAAPIARALDLEADALERLRDWLQQARVAWGLNADTRAHLGLPAYAEHSFAWGLQRLLTGYLYGDDDSEARTFDAAAAQVGHWPVTGVQGLAVEALGALDRLLLEIDALLRLAEAPRPLSQWCTHLHGLLDRLWRADPTDASEGDAIVRLAQLIENLRVASASANVDPLLPFALLRDLVAEQFDAVPERQAFLLGAATICGMVPQRSVPFRFIAVLGLNDGEFPRTTSDRGIDLMAQAPRLGDRDVRSDDRYLFLETVMAARGQLHLSYLAEGVRDGKPLNPAAPLAELLAFLDQRAQWSAADDEAIAASADRGRLLRPWHLQHALQPFDPRYFEADRDAMFFSYRASFAPSSREAAAGPARFVASQREPDAQPIAESIPLQAVLAYYKDPARALLTSQLRMRLDALDVDESADSEPLTPTLPKFERVPRRLVLDALAHGVFDVPELPPPALRLGGLLPPGELADIAWRKARDSARAILHNAAADDAWAGSQLLHAPLAFELELDGWLLHGQLERVFRIGDQYALLEVFADKSEADLGFRERVPLFIEWATLRLLLPHEDCQLRVLCKRGRTSWFAQLQALDLATLRADLLGLIAFWLGARQQTRWYFPATSWAIARAEPEQAPRRAADAWRAVGGERGEAVHAPGYAAWLARGVDLFDRERADWADLSANAQHLADLIHSGRAP